MFSLDNYDVKITVNLDNGLYVFDNESASGKSRLCALLKKYRVYGEPVAGYTYADFVNGLDIGTVLRDGYKLVLIDRYDMYLNHAIDRLEAFARSSIVLVDCKYGFAGSDFDWCYIQMTSDTVEVC